MARYDDRRSFRERFRDHDQDRSDYPVDPGYDPDHAYRARRYRGRDEEQPYVDRPLPGEHGDDPQRRPNRPWNRQRLEDQRLEEEHLWRRPSSWYGGAGPYRGVGPKGYALSDERVREHVCDALTDDPHLNAAEIEVEVKDREVTLSGGVDSRAAKRHAEDLAMQATGVKDVQNNLRVVKERA